MLMCSGGWRGQLGRVPGGTRDTGAQASGEMCYGLKSFLTALGTFAPALLSPFSSPMDGICLAKPYGLQCPQAGG